MKVKNCGLWVVGCWSIRVFLLFHFSGLYVLHLSVYQFVVSFTVGRLLCKRTSCLGRLLAAWLIDVCTLKLHLSCTKVSSKVNVF